MDHNTPTSRWYHAWRGRPAPKADAADAADLGTAFGLDLSLGESLYDPPAAASTAAVTPPRWMPRLGRRAGGD